MKTSLIGIVALIIGMTGIYGVASAQERGDDGGERFFGYMDRNRDGRLDAEEVQRMPGSFRDQLQRSGIRVERGVSKDEFLRVMPRIMEEMRRQRERGRDGDDDDRRRDEERRREEERRRQESSRGPGNSQPEKKREVAVYSPRKIEPVTIEIPSQFTDGDIDQDGQLGLYEWRKWKPEARNEFQLRDRNGDGFLTPQELQLPLPTPAETPAGTVAAAPANGQPQSSGRPGTGSQFGNRSRGPGSSPYRGSRDGERTGPYSQPSNAPPQDASSTEESAETPDRLTNTARFIFGTLDKDKDETLSPDEISSSRVVKPKFESAGIDMTQPMSQQQFIEAYLKAFAT